MPTPRVLGVIPARLDSERLPRKPLQKIAGKTLIEWVWSRVGTFDCLDRLVVATDSDEVAAVCRSAGAHVEMTSPEHRSGTERVAEVATRSAFRGYEVIVNIQGDEPFVTGEQVRMAAGLVIGGWDIGTVAAPARSARVWRDPAVVKVVRGGDGAALYFSRAPIPHPRGGAPSEEALAGDRYLRHVGVYAYSGRALEKWVALPQSELEGIESLEQLRPLAAGLRIGVALVEEAHGGIDTPADLAQAEGRLETILSAPHRRR